MDGMICPFCGNEESKVVDSRTIDSGIKRRRECKACKIRWNTYEYSEFFEENLEKRQADIARTEAAVNKIINSAIDQLQDLLLWNK